MTRGEDEWTQVVSGQQLLQAGLGRSFSFYMLDLPRLMVFLECLGKWLDDPG
jgi:hypothetical protein